MRGARGARVEDRNEGGLDVGVRRRDDRAVVLLEEVLVLVGKALVGGPGRVKPGDTGVRRCKFLAYRVVVVPIAVEQLCYPSRIACKAGLDERIGPVADRLWADVRAGPDEFAVHGRRGGLPIQPAALGLGDRKSVV